MEFLDEMRLIVVAAIQGDMGPFDGAAMLDGLQHILKFANHMSESTSLDEHGFQE